MKNNILNAYSTLLEKYGKQGWWPVNSKNADEKARACQEPSAIFSGVLEHYQNSTSYLTHKSLACGILKFEISIGAILTQNTSWKNAEKAIKNLIEKNLLSPELMLKTPVSGIAECIKPAGYYNQKAERLKIFSEFFLKEFDRLKKLDAGKARQMLLGVKGIGPETADSILLYALNKPIFVIDAYTKRMFSRMIGIDFKTYSEWQDFFHENLKDIQKKAEIFNEFHALIVEHCKNSCKKEPVCGGCCLDGLCKRKIPNA